ncbi:MAG: DUF6445 family protein [Pseudomonadota bacterium]
MTSPADPAIHRFGTSNEPLVVIDNFSTDPAALVASAARQRFQPMGIHYPGIRSPADPAYLGEQADLLETVLRTVFGLARGADLVECAYSLVTTPPDRLTPIQRIPHFDSTDPGRLALLHYLCGEDGGGTAFYRHRETGFETITSARLKPYDTALKAAPSALPETGYISGSTALFEQTGAVNARFNRLVIYRGYRLHSGTIPNDLPFDARPETGRLTINTFLQAR